jgi:hypothetical protein
MADGSSAVRYEIEAVRRHAARWMWINVLIAVVGVVTSVASYQEAAKSPDGGTY